MSGDREDVVHEHDCAKLLGRRVEDGGRRLVETWLCSCRTHHDLIVRDNDLPTDAVIEEQSQKQAQYAILEADESFAERESAEEQRTAEDAERNRQWEWIDRLGALSVRAANALFNGSNDGWPRIPQDLQAADAWERLLNMRNVGPRTAREVFRAIGRSDWPILDENPSGNRCWAHDDCVRGFLTGSAPGLGLECAARCEREARKFGK